MSSETTPYDELFQMLISLADASEFIDRIDEALERLFQAKISFTVSMAEIFPRTQKELLMAILEAEKIEVTDLAAVEGFFRTLKDKVTKLPVLELTLAVDPSEKLLQDVQEWVAVNVHMKVLIETKVNSKLIGGLMISINGYYHDYSIAKLLHSA